MKKQKESLMNAKIANSGYSKKAKYRVYEFDSDKVKGMVEIDNATASEGIKIAKRMLSNIKKANIREVLC